MKNFLILALLSLSIASYSQARLNYTEGEIVSEFGKTNKITVDYSDAGDKILNISTKDLWISYWFYKKSTTCNAVMIMPLTQGALNGIVEMYNKNYVIVSSTEWRMYSENGSISIITLHAMEEDGSYFLWTPENL